MTKPSPKKKKPTLKQQVAQAQEIPPIPRAAIKMILLNQKTGVEDWSFAVGANAFADYEKEIDLDKQEGDFRGTALARLCDDYKMDAKLAAEIIESILEIRNNSVMNERDRLWKHAKNVEAGISGGFLDGHGVKLTKEEEK